MELNREQIIKALECCTRSGCSDYQTKDCPLKPYEDCSTRLAVNALALITSQEQRIKELTEERDTFREYAYKMQMYVENIKHNEDMGYEPSAARYASEMEMWRVVALEKKKLSEENERLRAEVSVKKKLLDKNVDIEDKVKADTVRKMQALLNDTKFKFGSDYYIYANNVDIIAKEMLEGDDGTS